MQRWHDSDRGKLNVMVLNGGNLVHIPMNLRARTSALDMWLSVIKWTKVNYRSLLGDPENELHLVVVCYDSCSFTQCVTICFE